jgi:hypothetical protein
LFNKSYRKEDIKHALDEIEYATLEHLREDVIEQEEDF